MSKPLTGSINHNEKRGTFTAGLPAGQGGRRTATFDTRREAELWVAEGIRLLKAGQVVPPYQRTRSAKGSTPATGTAFITVAREHIAERYAEDGYGDVDRECQVTGYAQAIEDYLAHHGLYLETISRRDVRAMWQHMLKTGGRPSGTGTPEGLDPDQLVTKKDALRVLAAHGSPVSESTFKRAVLAGKLTATDRSGHAHLFRVGDLFSDRAGLVRAGADTGPPHRGRFAHSTLVDVRRTFRAVVAHAKADGIVVQSGVRSAKIPPDKSPKVRIRALTHAEATRLATRLHAVHQLVLWLLMLLGLRVSEAYGILLDDVIDYGAGRPGLVIIQSQGGRNFRTRRADGSTTVTTHLDRTKGSRSSRVLVVPPSLMDLIRTVIDIFHADDHGIARPGARLVPGLHRGNQSGQSAFHNALKRAGAEEGIDITFNPNSRGTRPGPGATPTPQKLRQSYATSHRAGLIPVEDIRTTLGQGLGGSVLHTNYLIDDLGLAASRRISEETQKQLDEELEGSLLIPTPVRCTTGRQPALLSRAAEIDAKLTDVGWLVQAVPVEDWVTVSDAAAYWGVSEHQLRDDIRAGKLPAIVTQRPEQRGIRYLIRSQTLLTHAVDRHRSDLSALAEELDLPYDVIRQFVARSPSLTLARDLGRRAGSLSDEDAEKVRTYFGEQQALLQRAVRMTDVASELGMSTAMIGTLVKRGVLVEDIRFHGGHRSLTLASVDEFKRQRSGRRDRA